jgi:hypothetical protein
MTTPATFSEAALWRLLDCYRMPRETDGPSAVDVWLGLISEATHVLGMHIYAVEFNELLGARYQDDDDNVLRVVGLAGLVELGVRAGYIDLGEVHNADQAAAVRDALEKFEAERLQGSSRTELTLFRALRQRYETQDYRATTRDETAFGMFEAYVDLTDTVLKDRACRRFIEETHGGMQLRRFDEAVLLSPRHFADAVATGRVGAIEGPEVSGGLAMLRHLDRLMSIVEQLDTDTALREGLVRHARWARDAQTLRLRFERWAEAMAEWSESGMDADGMTAWSEYRSRVFSPLIREQTRLAAPGEEAETAESTAPPNESALSAEEDARQLAAQGRTGAARARLRAEVQSRFEAIRPQPGSDWVGEAEELVRLCTVLADLGDVDSAAAYVAPLMGDIASQVGTQYQMYADAASIVARARLSVGLADPAPNVEEGAPRRPTRERGSSEAERHRSSEEGL